MNARLLIVQKRDELREINTEEYDLEGYKQSSIVADKISLVGSFNLDPCSSNIDTELMLIIESKEFASTFLNTIDDEYLSKALLVNSSIDDPRDIFIEKREPSAIKKAIIIALIPLSYIFRFLA